MGVHQDISRRGDIQGITMLAVSATDCSPSGRSKHPAKTRFALSGMEFSHDSGHEVAPMEGVGLSGITRTSGACLQKGINNDTLKEKSMRKWQALAFQSSCVWLRLSSDACSPCCFILFFDLLLGPLTRSAASSVHGGHSFGKVWAIGDAPKSRVQW